MNLREILVRPIRSFEEQRYQELMRQHHYLGGLPKIGETLWYVAAWQEQWVALLSYSASALKCAARDRWIGWDFRHQYGRLKLVVNKPYPTTIPLVTAPAKLLAALPKLPEVVEYRLVDRRLLLRDRDANLIVDVLVGVPPARSR